MIKEVEKFCDIEQKQNDNKNGQHTDYIHHGIEYYKSNNIKYPNNFSLIESQFYYIFNEISGKKMNEIQGPTEKAKKGYIIEVTPKKENSKDKPVNNIFILLNYSNRKNNDIYLGISLKEFDFKVVLFIVNHGKVTFEDFIKLAKKQIEHNLYKSKEKNVKIKVMDGLETICYPDNIGKDDYIYNEKIYNKIFHFFSLDKMYNQFISSFKDIENHQLKENQINLKNIQTIILQQKKTLKETFVFLVDENIFKNKILDEVFLYFNYNIYCSVKDDEKMTIIERIFDRESEKE